MQNVTSILKEAERAGYIDEEEVMSGDGDDGEGRGEWGGFEDAPSATEPLDHEEEYVDEDRFTTVTVESVNVSRDGLVKPEEEQSDVDGQEVGKPKQQDTGSTTGAKDRTRKPKKKKQKFRYETKTERQVEQKKQKARKKRKAAAAGAV